MEEQQKLDSQTEAIRGQSRRESVCVCVWRVCVCVCAQRLLEDSCAQCSEKMEIGEASLPSPIL